MWFRLGAFQWRLYPWKKEKKPEKPKEAKQQPRPSKPEEPKPPILSPSGVFQLVRRLLPVALEGADAFRRRLQVDVLQLEIVAGGPTRRPRRSGTDRSTPCWGRCGSRRYRSSTSGTDGSMWTWTLTGGSPSYMGRPPCPSPPASFCGWACGTAPRCLNIFLDVRKQEKGRAGAAEKGGLNNGTAAPVKRPDEHRYGEDPHHGGRKHHHRHPHPDGGM